MWGDARSGGLHQRQLGGRCAGSHRLPEVWRYGGSHQMWGTRGPAVCVGALRAGPSGARHRPREAAAVRRVPSAAVGRADRRYSPSPRAAGSRSRSGEDGRRGLQWTEPGPHAASCRRLRCHGPHRRGQYGIPARRVRRTPAGPGRRSLIRWFRPAVGSAAGPEPPRRPNVPALECYRRRGRRSYGRRRPCRGPSAFRFPQPRQPTSSIYHNSIRTSEEGRSTVIGSDPLRNMSGGVLLSHTVPRAVPSALKSLTSGFGMGPGVSPSLLPPKLYGDITNLAHESEPYWRPYLGNRIVDA